MSATRTCVLDFLHENKAHEPTSGFAVDEIIERSTGRLSYLGSSAIRRACKDLVKSGDVQEARGVRPRRSKYYYLANPTPEAVTILQSLKKPREYMKDVLREIVSTCDEEKSLHETHAKTSMSLAKLATKRKSMLSKLI